MLSVCLIFLYVLLTAYLMGFLVLTGIGRFCAARERERVQEVFARSLTWNSFVMAGIIVLTVYAQVFSLFAKVGLMANVLVLAVSILTIVVFRKELRKKWAETGHAFTIRKAIGIFLLFLLFAYGTSRGIIHYDTGLYHAQSIRWIEEYGIVKGLGNLHCRLAYNSSAFSLSALFGFSFLGGQSYHCMAGLFAFLLAGECSKIMRAWTRRKLQLSDLARIMGIYYLLIIFDEMISPASDYFMVITVFYIIIRWLELLEQEEKSWIPYGLLCLVGVYAMSLKLSAAFILLLVIKPAVILIKDKNYKGIFSFIGLGIAIIAPYFIRNIVISGWLVYPFTAVDWFQADWKIPKGIADYDAKEIQVWGRGIYDVARFEEPISGWFSTWFSGLGSVDKLFVAGGISAAPVIAVAAAAFLVQRKSKMFDWVLVAATINFSFFFWLFSAPLIRYGCVYVWLAPVVTFGGLALHLIKSRRFWQIIYGVLLLVGIYKVFAFGKEVLTAYDGHFFLFQKDYENFDTLTYEIDGITFYYPEEGDRTGYGAFPASSGKADIMLRGADISDGFKYKEY